MIRNYRQIEICLDTFKRKQKEVQKDERLKDISTDIDQGKRFRQTSPDSSNVDDDMEEGELDSIEYLKTKIQEQQTSIECLEEALSRLIKLILHEDLR